MKILRNIAEWFINLLFVVVIILIALVIIVMGPFLIMFLHNIIFSKNEY
jgi:hypothetical protein